MRNTTNLVCCMHMWPVSVVNRSQRRVFQCRKATSALALDVTNGQAIPLKDMYLFKGVSCTYCCARLVPIPPCVCTCDRVLVYLALFPGLSHCCMCFACIKMHPKTEKGWEQG